MVVMAIWAPPFHREGLAMGDVVLEEGEELAMEKQGEHRFAVALLFGFLEVGEVWTLGHPSVAGDDSFPALRTGVGGSFFCSVHMNDCSFCIQPECVQQLLCHTFPIKISVKLHYVFQKSKSKSLFFGI